MNKSFIITFYIQGEFYKQKTNERSYDWQWLEDTKKEILKEYNGYKSIASASGSDGYNVLFNEDLKKTVCFHYVLNEITGLVDANGSLITVDDKLVLKSIADYGDEEKIKDRLVGIYCSGWNNGEYYLRSIYRSENHYKWDGNGHFICTEPAIADINGVTQELMKDYVIWNEK